MEELGNVLIGRPVNRHSKLIAVLCLELFLQLGLVKPILAEPVQIGELLVGQLIELAVRAGGEFGAHEVCKVKSGIGHVLAVACHEVGEIHRQLQAGVRADQIGIVDVNVVEIAVGLHLRLHSLHHFALAKDLVVDLDAGNFLERLGQDG
jgi:hypothetical protein